MASRWDRASGIPVGSASVAVRFESLAYNAGEGLTEPQPPLGRCVALGSYQETQGAWHSRSLIIAAIGSASSVRMQGAQLWSTSPALSSASLDPVGKKG